MIHRFCCCVESVDLTCPGITSGCPGGVQSAGLYCNCKGFPVSTTSRWGLCWTDATYPALDKTDPGYLMERYAEGQYRATEAGVRKMEFDYTNGAFGDDSYTIRVYLWESGAWALKRTTSATFANEIRVGGGKQRTVSGATFVLWAIDDWIPSTIRMTLSGVTVCPDCVSSTIYYGGVGYDARTVSFNFTSLATLTRASNTNDNCRYTGQVGTVTCWLYDWGTGDCWNGINLRHEVTLPINAVVVIAPDRTLSIEAYSDSEGSGASVFVAADSGAAGSQFDRLGEVVVVANTLDCDDFPIQHGDGGTATITIPPHGS